MIEPKVEAIYKPEHILHPAIISAAEDVDLMIESLAAASPGLNLAQLHSLNRAKLLSGNNDHELLVGINGGLGVGVLSYMAADVGNFVTRGPMDGRRDPSYSIIGEYTEFPDYSEIPIPLVGEAVKEFLATGGQRPACVQWQVPEFW
jgi:hypothetical protein